VDEEDVDDLVKLTLESLGLPVARIFFTGKAESWITYQLLLGRETGHADDEAVREGFLYRAHVFSRTNYLPIVKRVRKVLKAAGFDSIEFEAEIYEEDTGFYHIPIKFNFTEV